MQLILVSPPEERAEEPTIVTSMFDVGLQYFHLRKPEFSSQEIEAYLAQIPIEYHPRIILHYQFELAQQFNLKGIHFNSINVSTIQDYFSIPGLRSYSVRQVSELYNFKGKMDYALLSPGFMGKLRKDIPTMHQNLSKLLTNNSCPKLALLGGVNEENLPELKKFGFWGAAVLSDIWHASDNTSDMLRKVKLMLTLVE